MKKLFLPTCWAGAVIAGIMMLAMLLVPSPAFADSGTDVIIDKITYTLDAATKTATVKGYNIGTSTTVNIPGTVVENNVTYTVTAIGYKAFAGESITSVTMNSNLLTIGESAFQNCTSLATVSFPSTLTAIDKYAFQNCTALTELNIPNSLLTIGEYAFNECTALKDFNYNTYNVHLTTIGQFAFRQCTSLTSVHCPYTLTSIGFGAFVNCSNLQHATFYANTGLKELPQQCFYGCPVYDIVLPLNIEKIGIDCFNSPKPVEMRPLTLPATLTSIGTDAFNMSKESTGGIICQGTVPPTFNLHETTDTPFGTDASNIPVYVPAGSLAAYKSSRWGKFFTSITARYSDGLGGEYDLDETNHTAKLVSVSSTKDVLQYDVLETIQSEGNEYTVTSIAETILYNNRFLKVINISASVENIGTQAFSYAYALETVNFAEGSKVKTLPEKCFLGSDKLKEVRLPQQLETISFSCFATNPALTMLVLPPSVSSLDVYAFRYTERTADNALQIVLTSDKLTNLSKALNLINDDYSNVKVMVPESSLEAYQKSYWKNNNPTAINFSGYVDGDATYDIGPEAEATVTKVEDKAEVVMADYVDFHGVKLPVTKMADNLFNSNKTITSVTMPKQVTSLADKAFSGCANLKKAVLPEALTSMGDNCFDGCKALQDIDIPNSVTTIGSYCFNGCNSLQTMAVPEGITTIEVGTFMHCENMQTVQLPSTLTAIDNWAFQDCYALKSMEIPADVTTLGNAVFYNCTALANVVFKGTALTSLPLSTFQSTGLTAINVPEGVTTIGNSCFNECVSLKTVSMPTTLTAITGTECFFNCNALESIDLSKTKMTEILPGLFNFLEKLSSVKLPATLTTIGRYAFGHTAIVTVDLPASLQYINKSAFNNCSQLREIYVRAAVPPTCQSDDLNVGDFFDGNTYENAILYVLHSAYTTYRTADYWKNFNWDKNAYYDDIQTLSDANKTIPSASYQKATVRYTRTLPENAQYVTLCLPFNFYPVKRTLKGIEEIWVSTGNAINMNGSLLLMLKQLDLSNDKVLAGTPMLIKKSDDATQMEILNYDVFQVNDNTFKNPDDQTLTVFDWDGNSGLMMQNKTLNVAFNGTYADTDLTDGYTLNANGAFGTASRVSAFRAYVHMGNDTAKKAIKRVVLGIEGEATAIDGVTVLPEAAQQGAVYSVNGTMVNADGNTKALPKGVYIKNGKKIIVK